MQGSLGTSFFCQVCCPTEDNFKKQRKARICNQRSSGARRCSTLLDVCSTCWVFKIDVARGCSTFARRCPACMFVDFVSHKGKNPQAAKSSQQATDWWEDGRLQPNQGWHCQVSLNHTGTELQSSHTTLKQRLSICSEPLPSPSQRTQPYLSTASLPQCTHASWQSLGLNPHLLTSI